MSRYGPLYIYIKEEYLKSCDTKNYFAPKESFNYDQIKISKTSKEASL